MNPFMKRYKELGEEFDPEDIKIKPSLRINTLKTDFKLFNARKKAKLKKIEFLNDGYYYLSEFALSSTPEYMQGYYYLQESASQLCSEVLDPKPGEIVLDMCASPGSKTTHIAMLMKNKGILIALDATNPRLPKLQNNLERIGVTNSIVYKKDARFVDDLGIKFDKILLDAPCSGNFTQDSEWFEKRKLEDFSLMAKTQKHMLMSALDSLKVGGEMVYSTCSLEPEEDEEIIDWMLKERDDVELLEIKTDVGDPGIINPFGEQLNLEIKKCKRLWPHKTGTQGFFICKMKKL